MFLLLERAPTKNTPHDKRNDPQFKINLGITGFLEITTENAWHTKSIFITGKILLQCLDQPGTPGFFFCLQRKKKSRQHITDDSF